MREVVLDVVERAAKAVAGKCLGEELGNLLPLAAVPETAEHQADVGRMGRQIGDLAHAVGAAVLIDRDMVDIGEAQPGFAQAVGDGLRGKPRPMLDAAKALLFGGRHQFAVPHQRRRGIAVEGIEAEDDHPMTRDGSGHHTRSGRRSMISSAISISAVVRWSA